MARFQALHINRLDKKGRVSIPASFRAVLIEQGKQAITARKSLRHPAIECFGAEQVVRKQSEIDGLAPNSIELEDAEYTFFGKIDDFEWDSEGRVSLPASLIEHTRIVDRVAFIGLGRHFAIWEPAALDAFLREAEQREAARLPRAPIGARP